MSETKFTKGDWSIYGDWAITKDGWSTEVIATFEERGCGNKEGFANAYLIATAPEMYDVLETINSFLSEDGLQTDGLAKEIAKISEILTKARGE